MRAPSLLQPSPASATSSSTSTSARALNLNHQEEPSPQVIHPVIGGNGSCILWFSAIVINGKVIMFPTAPSLYSVSARIMLRKLGSMFPQSSTLIRCDYHGPVGKGKVGPCEIPSHLCSLKSEATGLKYEKNTKTSTATTKDTQQRANALSLLSFQHGPAGQFPETLKCEYVGR